MLALSGAPVSSGGGRRRPYAWHSVLPPEEGTRRGYNQLMVKASAIPLLLSGLLAGAFLPLQAGINARLRLTVGSPLQAAFISFVVGALALGVIVLVAPSRFPNDIVAQTPWWAWSGGLLGVFYISTAIVLSPRVGALVLTSLLMTGQLLTALILDHFGLLAFPKVPITSMRVLGVAFLIVGVILVLRRHN